MYSQYCIGRSTISGLKDMEMGSSPSLVFYQDGEVLNGSI